MHSHPKYFIMKTSATLLLLQFIIGIAYSQTHYGTSAGTSGALYSYFGAFAGNAALSSSYENSFFGTSSGKMTTTGHGNTAAGFSSLRENTTGYWNTVLGSWALRFNTTGHSNIAIGKLALENNQNGYENVAIGLRAMLNHTYGYWNTAIGLDALSDPVNSFGNTAVGAYALKSANGGFNTATGFCSMYALQEEGRYNSAFGNRALANNATGEYNSAFGSNAMSGPGNNTCAASYNSALGAYASTTDCAYTNYTSIGYSARATASNQVRLGNIYVTSIGGQVSWSTLSDGRFKKDLRGDVAGIDFIKQLRPVSYVVDKEALNKHLGIPDSMRVPTTEGEQNARQVGFVAQDVDAIIKKSGFVFSGIESPKNENDLYAIRYGEFVVPLVKAVQELIAEVDQLKEQLKQNTEQSSVTEKRVTTASLKQNTPNPFSSDTEIRMEIPDGSRQADIIVYNLEGKQLKNIPVSGRGDTAVKIVGNNLSAGMYLYTLIIDGEIIDTKRLLLR
jgi:trimeric autotransporter adhesin